MRLYGNYFFSKMILEIDDYGYLCSRSAKEAKVLRSIAGQNQFNRRNGRAVECTGLENQRTERYRGFESLFLRRRPPKFRMK